jgi:hypothetical protein
LKNHLRFGKRNVIIKWKCMAELEALIKR